MATTSLPMALESPRGVLLGAKGWAGVMAAAVTLLVLVPVLNLMVPQGPLFHLSDYSVSLVGNILCYAIFAPAMYWIWG